MQGWARSMVLGAAAGWLLAACNEDAGLSVQAACETFCSNFVDCTVDDPVNEDNVMQGCMTSCTDMVDAIEAANAGSEACEQAAREHRRCLGAQASCEEHESIMYGDDTCRSEGFDLAEHCPES